MDDMSQEAEITAPDPGFPNPAPVQGSAGASLQELALELGKLLAEHKGGKSLVLDLREMNAWTDFFVIATATSNTHLQGLERHIKEFTRERGIEILRRSRKPAAEDDEWCLIDLGPVVIHILSERARDFYELERLWSTASIIWKAP